MIKNFYFAHNFEDRIEFRQIELQLEEELGINLFNPFYDDPDRAEEMKELDERMANAKDRIQQLNNRFNRDNDTAEMIVRRDLKNLAKNEGLFTYVRKPSFGTSIEICNAKLMCLPIFFVSEVYSAHPWIKVYADRTFRTLEEFKEYYKTNKQLGADY